MDKLLTSEMIQQQCCGTTCDKGDLVERVKQLESQLIDAYADNTEFKERLRGGISREDFAKKCFDAGYKAAIGNFIENKYREFLQFKSEEL